LASATVALTSIQLVNLLQHNKLERFVEAISQADYGEK
jgi:hypothetical protein